MPAGASAPVGVHPLSQALETVMEISLEHLPGRPDTAPPGIGDKIESLGRGCRPSKPIQFTQPPLGTGPDDRIADLLRCGDTKPARSLGLCCKQDHVPPCNPDSLTVDTLKFRASSKSLSARKPLAPVRRQYVCGPCAGGRRALCDRSWYASARGSRGSSSGGDYWVETSFSSSHHSKFCGRATLLQERAGVKTPPRIRSKDFVLA